MVKTEYGQVEGIKKDGCTVYLGIPFAKPPVGKRAFKHPVKCDPWDGVLKVDHGSKNAIQATYGYFVGNTSRDCLYLNVFVPEHIGDEKLPVMFWIHGGAYATGAAGATEEGSMNLEYNLERFAVESNTVVVSANYRLNVYGFLNLNSISDNFDVNNGLFDLILALQFVNDNIDAFGGNSGNITIFGESAGGACVLALMAMDNAKGLFHKAISQSACIEHFFTYEEGAKYARIFLEKAGVKKTSELMNLSDEKFNEADRQLTKAVRMNRDLRCPFSPIIDGKYLPDEPKKLAQETDVPLLIGTTEDEGKFFIKDMKTFTMPFMSLIYNLDVKNDAEKYRQRACNALTREVFTKPLDDFLSGYSGQAFRYEYRYVVEGSQLGSCHASELNVMFGKDTTIDGVKIDKDDAVGIEMRKIWGKFAKTGNPGWNEYLSGKDTFII